MTFDEARLMASVNARAETLFESGYRARWAGPARLSVRNSKGAAYLVETRAQTCECPFFRAHQGRYPCKHLLGWTRLLWHQRSCRRTLFRVLSDLLDDLDEWKDWVGGPAQATHERAADEQEIDEQGEADER